MRSSPSARSRTRGAHGNRADARHDLTVGQMTVAHEPSAAIVGELVGMATEDAATSDSTGLGQKGAGAAAHQRIGKRPWLGKLDDVTVGHGVSPLQWRSGARTPHEPLTPSPTSAHSSMTTHPHLIRQMKAFELVTQAAEAQSSAGTINVTTSAGTGIHQCLPMFPLCSKHPRGRLPDTHATSSDVFPKV
jgi:hypothetical protein